ncbi:MAG TPA: OadG family transporter subunit, partial [Anaerolineae bacterium]|nr:OadG family transporter subunit [Anaerolineae bacterium]
IAMNDNLLIALQITLIGMSLVFGVIIVLWLVMLLLVRITAQREKPIEEAAAPSPIDQSAVKRRAAIAAVSVALAHELTPQLHEFPEPPTSLVSAWQAIQRSRYLTQRALQRRLRR